MLKQRVITALVLLLILALAVCFFDFLTFGLLLTLIALAGGWEWSRLAGVGMPSRRLLYCIILLLLGAATWLWAPLLTPWIYLFSLCFWVLVCFLLYSYPSGTVAWNKPSVILLMGYCVLMPTWFGLVSLRASEEFVFRFLMLILLIAAADSGAYFAGRAFGRHKLAEQVSPNKTWEGVAGGVLGCLLVSLLGGVTGAMLGLAPISWPLTLMLPLLMAFFSVVGDLFESMLKRLRQIKDSGNILPGHGGILDRIDGLVAATPVYLLLLYVSV